MHTPDGYRLLCNRDEHDTRCQATEPRVFTESQTCYVAPTDGNFGGTWIAANEHGMTLALLNRTIVGARPWVSRGHLVPELVCLQGLDQVESRLRRMNLAPFAGFRLIALEPSRPARLFEWDTFRLAITEEAEHRMPLTSSSFDDEGVARIRTAELARLIDTERGLYPQVLVEFHQSHGFGGNRPSAYSTCMHRVGARTVSFTCVEVSKSHCQLFYTPTAPCEQAPGLTVRLPREALARCG